MGNLKVHLDSSSPDEIAELERELEDLLSRNEAQDTRVMALDEPYQSRTGKWYRIRRVELRPRK
jgi:hypothetical protein